MVNEILFYKFFVRWSLSQITEGFKYFDFTAAIEDKGLTIMYMKGFSVL